jgi:hypothetical protein
VHVRRAPDYKQLGIAQRRLINITDRRHECVLAEAGGDCICNLARVAVNRFKDHYRCHGHSFTRHRAG